MVYSKKVYSQVYLNRSKLEILMSHYTVCFLFSSSHTKWAWLTVGVAEHLREKSLSLRFIIMSHLFVYFKYFWNRAKTCLIVCCVKTMLTLQTVVEKLDARCTLKTVWIRSSWDIFVPLWSVSNQTQAFVGLLKSHLDVFSRNHTVWWDFRNPSLTWNTLSEGIKWRYQADISSNQGIKKRNAYYHIWKLWSLAV